MIIGNKTGLLIKISDLLARKPFRHACDGLIVVSVLALVFSRVLYNGFVGDDLTLTIGNPVYKNFVLKDIFFGLANGLEYLPVRDLSLALDYSLWGERAGGFHAMSLLLYGGTCLGVYWTTLLLGRHLTHDHPERLALVTALLFGLHPTHAETVGMLACRNVLLSGLFTFLASGCYLRFRSDVSRRKNLWLASSLLFFFLGTMSKATGITLPLALLAIELSGSGHGLRRLRPLIPFIIVASAAFTLFLVIGLYSTIIGKGNYHGGIAGNIAVALQIPFFYSAKLLVPFGLGTEYPDRFSTALLSFPSLAALVCLAVVLAALIKTGRRYPLETVAFSWFSVFLLPVLNFSKTYPTVADRYIFLSSYGFALLLAGGLCRLAVWRFKLALAMGAALLMVWGGATVQRLPVWRTEVAYWEDALATNPLNIKAMQGIGAWYLAAGKFGPALTYFARAKTVKPDDPLYDYVQGDIKLQQGNPAAALPHLLDALKLKDDAIMVLYDLGETYAALGHPEKAITAYRLVFTSQELDPQGFYKRAAEERLRKLGSLP